MGVLGDCIRVASDGCETSGVGGAAVALRILLRPDIAKAEYVLGMFVLVRRIRDGLVRECLFK